MNALLRNVNKQRIIGSEAIGSEGGRTSSGKFTASGRVPASINFPLQPKMNSRDKESILDSRLANASSRIFLEKMANFNFSLPSLFSMTIDESLVFEIITAL